MRKGGRERKRERERERVCVRVMYVCVFVLLRNARMLECVCVLCQQVVLGGGQEAREVTTTTTKAGKFDADSTILCLRKKLVGSKVILGP